MSLVVDPLDQVIALLLSQAAATAHPEPGDKSFLEKRLVRALGDSLATCFGSQLVALDKKLVGGVLADWDPQPGTIDLAVVTPAYEPRVVFEAKIDDIEWTLWDIYKMVSATLLPTVDAAYVVVAAPPKVWTSKRDCVELFDFETESETPPGEVEWYSSFLFSEYHRAWKDLLGGGSGRLVRVPDQIRLTHIGVWPLPAYPPYELRAVRVATVEDSGWLPFEDDWPVSPAPMAVPSESWPRMIPTEDLHLEDLPAADAPEEAYDEFAVSFDGYRELGSLWRCGKIAKKARDRWRETRELPVTMKELRGCLFFEQRRVHFGFGSYDETMPYLQAIVARMRELLIPG